MVFEAINVRCVGITIIRNFLEIRYNLKAYAIDNLSLLLILGGSLS